MCAECVCVGVLREGLHPILLGCGWFLCMVALDEALGLRPRVLERDKGIRWMPWHQEAMKDVARCEKPWGAASRR